MLESSIACHSNSAFGSGVAIGSIPKYFRGSAEELQKFGIDYIRDTKYPRLGTLNVRATTKGFR
jgi:hypothetical protein